MSAKHSSESTIPRLPQSGWDCDHVWYTALQLQRESFRKLVKKHRIPFVALGASWILHAESVYQHLTELMNDAEQYDEGDD